MTGHRPAGSILFQVPGFRATWRTPAGAVDSASGTVTLSAGTRSVTVTMQHAVCHI